MAKKLIVSSNDVEDWNGVWFKGDVVLDHFSDDSVFLVVAVPVGVPLAAGDHAVEEFFLHRLLLYGVIISGQPACFRPKRNTALFARRSAHPGLWLDSSSLFR